MQIAPFYAAVLVLVYFALSVRTLLLRRRLKIAIGDADDPRMLRAMRAHANFAEYVPLTLLLIAMLELSGDRALAVHVLGSLLIVGRLSHAYGVSQLDENYRYRVFGMAMTFTAMVSAATTLLALSLASWAA